MSIEYDSKAIIRKMEDDRYELCWNVNSSILSVMTERQVDELIEALQKIKQQPSLYADIYHFPVMRYRVTG